MNPKTLQYIMGHADICQYLQKYGFLETLRNLIKSRKMRKKANDKSTVCMLGQHLPKVLQPAELVYL